MSASYTTNGNKAVDRDVFADTGPPPPFSRPQSIVSSQSMPPGTSRGYDPGQGATTPTGTSSQSAEFNAKLGTLKAWSVNTFKCTKQIIQEKMGKTSRTVDAGLETRVEKLRDTQTRYRLMLEAARRMSSNFKLLLNSQRCLGDMFTELGQRQPELGQEFGHNAETQRLLTMNGDRFLAALDLFITTLETLSNKTIEDTLLTVRNYEQARLEFDAYRTEAEVLAANGNSINGTRLQEAEARLANHRAKFDRLREDVDVKIKLLDDNRVRVMQKQLLLFHNAISSYFSGNKAALDETVKQFSVKVKTGNGEPTSFLEQS